MITFLLWISLFEIFFCGTVTNFHIFVIQDYRDILHHNHNDHILVDTRPGIEYEICSLKPSINILFNSKCQRFQNVSSFSFFWREISRANKNKVPHFYSKDKCKQQYCNSPYCLFIFFASSSPAFLDSHWFHFPISPERKKLQINSLEKRNILQEQNMNFLCACSVLFCPFAWKVNRGISA